jgi:lipoprotein-anchoring transpeptidase ErfK/SrfK
MDEYRAAGVLTVLSRVPWAIARGAVGLLALLLTDLSHRRRARWVAAGALCLAALVAANGGYVYTRGDGEGKAALGAAAGTPPAVTPATEDGRVARRERARLEAALARKVPGGTYIVIDQTHNRLYLKRGERVLLEAVCSGGSGMVLKESGGGKRTWIFDTPRGVFRVTYKTENPVWKKPDWAFVEEGRPIPSDQSERFEYGVLGKYALSFGNGYMIHGTLYERLLGRSVTHGCIRLGADNLWKVYSQCPVGTPIYIY